VWKEAFYFFGSSSHGTSARVLWGLDYPWRYASHRDSAPVFQRSPQALHVIRCGMSVIAVPGGRRKRNYVVKAGAARLGCAWVERYVGMNAMPGFVGSSDHMNSWKRATYSITGTTMDHTTTGTITSSGVCLYYTSCNMTLSRWV
jgi:hypothetical protein